MNLRWTAQALAGLLAFVLLLVACGEEAGNPTAAEDPAGDPLDSEEDLPASPDEGRSAEEIYADIAAMGLSYEERLDYLSEKAVEEGAVLLYGASNLELIDAWSEGFQETYPEINHLYVRQRIDELLERILAEARSGRHLVDVIDTTAVSGAALHAEGLLAEHHGVPVPQAYPEEYIEAWSVVQSLNPQVITWNTNAITEEEAPREWDDFLEPKHSGCILASTSQSFVASMIADRGYEATEAWLQGFLDNGGIVQRSLGASARAIAAGEFDCAVYLNAHTVESLIVDDGAPLEWHAPAPTFASASGVYIYKHTERPHAAALLTHWLLGEDGAQVVADDGRVTIHPQVQLRFERFQPWLTPGSEFEQHLQPLLSADALDLDEQALHLIETYLIPNLVQD